MIFKSSNEGETWTKQVVPTLRNVNAVCFFDEKRGFAVGDSGLVLFTANGGVATTNHPPLPFHLSAPVDGDTMVVMRSITFRWERAFDADGDSVRYTLLISGDRGKTWLAHGPTTDTALQVHSPAQVAGPYFWMVVASDGEHVSASLDVFKFTITSSTWTELEELPRSFALYQNYPNPFNPTTTIGYELPRSATISLRIFNTLGQLVATLVDEQKEMGYHRIQWKAEVPSGIYFCHLQACEVNGGKAEAHVVTRRMIVVK
jgi:hypothetical protein